MRIILLGTGPFAVPSLRTLEASEHKVLMAVSRPPRGRKPMPAPVQVAAESLGIPDWQPETVNSDEARARLRELRADLLVVCDYGEILKSETLAIARLGGINLHGSLLPKYRGAAPVQWAVLNGDSETGNTVIQMTPGLDAGPALGVERVAIDPDETAGELEVRLAELGAALVLRVVDELATGTESPVEQDKSQATKAPRLAKEHGEIDWSRSAVEIKNQVRALQPWPRAFTDWHRSADAALRLIVHRVALCDETFSESTPGNVVSTTGQLVVTTGDGFLSLLEVQPAGKRVMRAEEFLRGNPMQVGDELL
ncbi:methionyl-tRNA formyltransferase [Bythopirellula goksoeyrii]|uniref:Methionyl-tRNA formyltransferase n=1 Tax=Bythopirellula goksoeyrii TaxID=1400387 RepID=A0A5B9QEY8_9BACT|nr:methionyl-tRNA formyltransferase [Bythopirellula goksoeyrii]QEG37524.1 Methionyl-tRNA formyltransferase [Bythopirellula goksoeyrii]